MAGITPLEGQDYIAEVLYSQALVAETLVMGLFVNTAGVLVEASVWANITEASGGGYVEKTLSSGGWSVASGGVATFAQQSWTATGSWALPVYGYYVRTSEGTPRIMHFEYSPNGSRIMTENDLYTVDPSSNTEST